MQGRATVQEAILRAIGPQACLTTAEITAAVNRPRQRVATTTGSMIIAGYIERLSRGCFRLTPEGKKALEEGRELRCGPRGPSKCFRKPLPDTLRQRAWSAMRLRGQRFTVADILTLASRPDEKSADTNIRKYLKALVGAGYVLELAHRTLPDSLTSNGCKVFRLLKDTGELAPRWRVETGEVIELNTEVRA